MSKDAVLIVAALTAFALSALLSAAVLPVLKKLKAGQTVLGYVEKHAAKSGTPTMGGTAFVLAAAVVTFAFCRTHVARVAAGAMLGYGLIGFLDDLIKVVFKRNLGLKAYQKIVGQAGVTAILVAYGYRVDGGTIVHIPFFGADVDLGAWYIPLAAFAYVGTVNSVNLTDGLDGLAAGTGTVYFAVMGVICTMTAATTAADGDLALMSFVLAGALTAFLWFNSHPARMFMGDTGSLALGGAAATVAILSHNVFLIPLIGIMYVVSGISVIVQVVSFKLTGKRVFAMAPFHHHLEYRGVKESKIVAQYTIVTAVAGAVALLAAAI